MTIWYTSHCERIPPTELISTSITSYICLYIYKKYIKVYMRYFGENTWILHSWQISIIEHSVINYSHCVMYHILRLYSGLYPSTNLSLFPSPHKPWQPAFTLYFYTPCLLTLTLFWDSVYNCYSAIFVFLSGLFHLAYALQVYSCCSKWQDFLFFKKAE